MEASGECGIAMAPPQFPFWLLLELICLSNRFLTEDTKLGLGSSSLLISFRQVHLTMSLSLPGAWLLLAEFVVVCVEFKCAIEEYVGSERVVSAGNEELGNSWSTWLPIRINKTGKVVLLVGWQQIIGQLKVLSNVKLVLSHIASYHCKSATILIGTNFDKRDIIMG